MCFWYCSWFEMAANMGMHSNPWRRDETMLMTKHIQVFLLDMLSRTQGIWFSFRHSTKILLLCMWFLTKLFQILLLNTLLSSKSSRSKWSLSARSLSVFGRYPSHRRRRWTGVWDHACGHSERFYCCLSSAGHFGGDEASRGGLIYHIYTNHVAS